MARQHLCNRWLALPITLRRTRHRTSLQVSRSIRVLSHRNRRQDSEMAPTRRLVVRRSEEVVTLASTNSRLVGSRLPNNNSSSNSNNNNINSALLKMRNTTSHSLWIQAHELDHILTLNNILSTPHLRIRNLPHRGKSHEETTRQQTCLQASSCVNVVPRSPESLIRLKRNCKLVYR